MATQTKGYGEPIYRLRIDRVLDPVSFSGEEPQTNCFLYLEDLARICNFARRAFLGPKYVTDKGYLLYVEESSLASLANVPFHTATLNIEENKKALRFLEEIIGGRANDTAYIEKVKLTFDNGEKHFVKSEGRLLYLPLVREKLDSKLIIA